MAVKAHVEVFGITINNEPIVKVVLTESMSDRRCIFESKGGHYYETGDTLLDIFLLSSEDFKEYMKLKHILLYEEEITLSDDYVEGDLDRYTNEQLMESVSRLQTEKGRETLQPVYQMIVTLFDLYKERSEKEKV